MSKSVETLREEGRLAFERGDGAASRAAYEEALAECEDGELCEGLARSLYLEADYRASITAHERAFAAYRDEGDLLGAARAARMLAWLHGNLYGDWAVFGGWQARAERLLEQAGENSPEHGWVELMRAMGEPVGPTREGRLRAAVELGRRFGEPDLEFEALGWVGYDLVRVGELEQGMHLLDEALAGVCSGEVKDIYVIEGVFCGMFAACEYAHDVARVEQWLRAADDIVQKRGEAPVGAFCRAHYGGILTAAGRWEEAEAALTHAARMFERGYTASRAKALARLADLRVRQGRLEEAAQLIQGLDQHRDAVRALAALHLARGETVLARDVLERALSEVAGQATIEGPLLALLVDVQLAEGKPQEAAGSTRRLAELAAAHASDYLAACAALTQGKVCLATESGDARDCLRRAVNGFSKAQMPVELARARLELARAATDEHPEVAVAEAKAALEVFELCEAARDADAAASLLRSLGAPIRTGPKGREGLTKREAEVLALLGHGLSNPEIADRLFISAKTAEHHVGKILSKLGLRNRAEAAAYAARAADEKT